MWSLFAMTTGMFLPDLPCVFLLYYVSFPVFYCGIIHLGKCWSLTCPIFPLGLTSFRSHIVAQLEMGAEPWVPDQVDMTSAMARGVYRGPDSGKWGMGEHVASLLSSNHTCHFSCVHHSFGAKPMDLYLFYLSFPIFGILTTGHFFSDWGLCLCPSLFPQLPLQHSSAWACTSCVMRCAHFL